MKKKLVFLFILLIGLTACTTSPKPAEKHVYSVKGLGTVELSIDLPIEGEADASFVNYYDESQLVRLSMFIIRNQIDVEMMNAIVSSHLKSDSFDAYGSELVTFSNGKYQVYYHYGYIEKEDQMFSNWVFQDELGVVHLVSFLSDKAISELIVPEINNTFELTLFSLEEVEALRIEQVEEETKQVGNPNLGYIDVANSLGLKEEAENRIVYGEDSSGSEVILTVAELGIDKTIEDYVREVLISQQIDTTAKVVAANTAFDFSGITGYRVLIYDAANDLGKAIFVFARLDGKLAIIEIQKHPYLLKEAEWSILDSYQLELAE